MVLAVGLAGRGLQNAVGEASVAGGRIGDAIELIIGDDVLFEASLCVSVQNVVELVVVVLVHPDVLAGAETADEAVVDAAEQFLFLVGDANDRELGEAWRS